MRAQRLCQYHLVTLHQQSHLLKSPPRSAKTIDQSNWFKKYIKMNLNNIYAQKWAKAMFNNTTCLNYRAKQTQKHVLKLAKKRYVYALCKLKCANHSMPTCSNVHVSMPNGLNLLSYTITHTQTCRKCNSYLRVLIIMRC